MITLDLKDGSVDILGKSSNSVTHTLTYQICESAMPSNCAQGTVTIALSGGGGGGADKPSQPGGLRRHAGGRPLDRFLRTRLSVSGETPRYDATIHCGTRCTIDG